MKQARRITAVLCIFALIGTILLACSRDLDEPSNAVGTNDVNTTRNGASTAAGQAGKETASSTRKFTDYKGHEVEISTSPQRVIFVGETFGDLVALDVNAVGGGFIKDYVFEEQVKNTEDIGFPINLEKALGLNPDLIITGNTDEKEQLHEEEIEPGETASVFTYYPVDRLFIMARTGLSQVLYDPNGFQPAGMIQDVLDANKGFETNTICSHPEQRFKLIMKQTLPSVFIKLRLPSSESGILGMRHMQKTLFRDAMNLRCIP